MVVSLGFTFNLNFWASGNMAQSRFLVKWAV